MLIMELEKLLDMPRATIRYYEREGLISPARSENGYREYTPEHARELERIRLLRALDCTVAEIRLLQSGEAELGALLRQKREQIDRLIADKAAVREICEDICRTGGGYEDLDAKKYLSGAWRAQESAGRIEPPKDMPQPVSLWRRFWARMLDWQIYTGIWSVLLSFLWPAAHLSDSAGWTLAEIAAGNIAMIALEPLLLRCFGTTPGKRVLGLRVMADAGGRPTLAQARARTLGVLWHGLRLGIPVVELRGMWVCYKDSQAGEPLSWEDESFIVQKGDIRRRAPAYIALRLLIALALVCCMGLGRMPEHRGELSPEQFAENYNRLIRAYGEETREIDANGAWIIEPEQQGVVTVWLGGAEAELSGVDMDVQDDVVRGARLEMRAEAGEEGNMLFLPTGAMARSAMALVCAESPRYREMWGFGSDAFRILEFCENIDPTGRTAMAEEIGGISLRLTDGGEMQEYATALEIGGWRIEYKARTSGGVYATSAGGAVILPEGERGVFEMEFMVFRK